MKIGVVSDIHEDITRLRVALEILRNEACDEVICLGDFVGYSVPYFGFLWSRDAHEVIETLKAGCTLTVAGNHDLFAIRKLPRYKAGFPYPKNWYSLDYQTRKRLANDKLFLYEYNELPALLTNDDEGFIDGLLEFCVKRCDGMKVLFSHYAYPDLVGTTTQAIKKSEDAAKHFEFMAKHGCSLGISGHDHGAGLKVVTMDEARAVPFNRVVRLEMEPTWLVGPSVVNGKFDNGILCLDTDRMEVEAIPLKTKRHVVPSWRKL